MLTALAFMAFGAAGAAAFLGILDVFIGTFIAFMAAAFANAAAIVEPSCSLLSGARPFPAGVAGAEDARRLHSGNISVC